MKEKAACESRFFIEFLELFIIKNLNL